MNKLKQIYKVLYKRFGKQKWWPTTLEGEMHPTYHGKKINDRQRFEIVVGAILTQNTSWKNVEKAITELNKNNLMDVKKIAWAETKKLAQLIKSSGYYNQKAERLKIISEHILKNYKRNLSKFFDKNIDELRQELLSIKGIGPETADSIMLYSAGKPLFVVDAYTKRIFSRAGLFDEKAKYEEMQELFHNDLERDEKLFNEYHALIVELGKNYCRKKPECRKCPIISFCKKDL